MYFLSDVPQVGPVVGVDDLVLTMAETLEKSISESEMAKEMRAFGKFFAEKLEVLPPEEL